MIRAAAFLKLIVQWIYGLKPAIASIRGYLNPVELARVVGPLLIHGATAYAILTAVIGDASAIFAAPYVAGVVSVLTAIVQVLRLLGHGDTPAAPVTLRSTSVTPPSSPPLNWNAAIPFKPETPIPAFNRLRPYLGEPAIPFAVPESTFFIGR